MRAAIIRALGAVLGLAGAVVLAWGTASRVCAQPCTPGGATWRIYSELDRRSTMDTENGRTTSRNTMTGNGSQHSDNGQDVTDSFTSQSDENGARESERICLNGTLANPRESTCWSDDGSVSTLSRDWDRDAAGNTVQRVTDTTVTKNGDRTTTTVEKTCDSQGHCTTKGPEVRRDKVAPPERHACEKPYWTGVITGTLSIDDASSSGGEFGGVGRNQQSQASFKRRARDITTAVLVAPDPLQAGGNNALVSRAIQDDTFSSFTKTQEIYCDGGWKPWQHANNASIVAKGNRATRDGAMVALQGDGSFRIWFRSPDVSGTIARNETNTITPGKCWGWDDSPGRPDTSPTMWSGRSWDANGRVDPKQQDSLSGSQAHQAGVAAETIQWNVTRFDPARSRLKK